MPFRFTSFNRLGFLALLLFSFSCQRCPYGCINGVCLKQQCDCEIFWEGDACERSVLSVYQGDYLVNEDCRSNLTEEIVSIQPIPTEPGKMEMSNGFVIEFEDIVRFRLDLQSFDGGMVEGQGQMLLNLISINYIYLDSLGSASCLFEAQKNQ